MTALAVDNVVISGPSGVIVERVDLTIAPGETVALVGESGSGKSITAKAITGLLPNGVRATGRVRVLDRNIDLAGSADPMAVERGRRISLLLQNPFTSLSPMHRCGPQIAAALGGGWRQRRASSEEVARRLDEVDLPARVAGQFPFELSGGMRQRVALAASLASDPAVLIGDEPTTALDVTTQGEVLNLLETIQRQRSMALLLITHDLGVARQRADRVVVMYAGRVVETGPVKDVFDGPRHPYTAALRDCDPPLEQRVERLPTVPGSVPRAWDVGTACAFAPRCAFAEDRCRSEEPPLVGDGRQFACWYPLGAPGESAPEHSAAGESAPDTALPDVALPDVALPDTAPADGSPAAAAATLDVQQLVSVRGLSKQFGGSSSPLALDDVSIEVGGGQAVGVVGESGSGKTTLARVLVGLERPTGGAVEWHVPGPAARRVQVVFQDPASALNPAMSVGAALTEALRAGQRDDVSVAELLEWVGLPQRYASRRPAALSGGEQQRVAIARAIAPRPRLLICDEPVSALDVSVQAQILNLLGDLHRRLGVALLFITHDLAVVRQIADVLYVMRGGRVVESGATENVLRNPTHAYTRALFAAVPGRREDDDATDQ